MIIGGPGVIVEVDEAKFGKRKDNRGHYVEGVWIFGGVERTEERKVFAVKVDDRSRATLTGIIQQHVLQGSIIYSDMWRGYSGPLRSWIRTPHSQSLRELCEPR